MDILQSVFFLFMCTVLQLALGQETEAPTIGSCHEIEIEDAPFTVGFLRNENDRLVCAGSIVDRQFILTSASCGDTLFPIRRAHVGTKKARKGGYFVEVLYTVCHEEFNKNTLDNNICLLKLRTPILLEAGRSEMAIVRLPDQNINTAAGTMVNVTGWGSISSKHDFSENLKQATIPVVSDATCSHYAPNMTENMLCAGNGGLDKTCWGDDGGPLTLNNVQLGIVSSAPATCGRSATVFTKVSNYVTWITSTIEKNKRPHEP